MRMLVTSLATGVWTLLPRRHACPSAPRRLQRRGRRRHGHRHGYRSGQLATRFGLTHNRRCRITEDAQVRRDRQTGGTWARYRRLAGESARCAEGIVGENAEMSELALRATADRQASRRYAAWRDQAAAAPATQAHRKHRALRRGQLGEDRRGAFRARGLSWGNPRRGGAPTALAIGKSSGSATPCGGGFAQPSGAMVEPRSVDVAAAASACAAGQQAEPLRMAAAA